MTRKSFKVFNPQTVSINMESNNFPVQVDQSIIRLHKRKTSVIFFSTLYNIQLSEENT